MIIQICSSAISLNTISFKCVLLKFFTDAVFHIILYISSDSPALGQLCILMKFSLPTRFPLYLSYVLCVHREVASLNTVRCHCCFQPGQWKFICGSTLIHLCTFVWWRISINHSVVQWTIRFRSILMAMFGITSEFFLRITKET